MTDIIVIYSFYTIWQKESCTNNINGSAHGLYLFILSIVPLLLYRIVSSIILYYYTKNFYHFLLQIFDLEIFRTLYLTYKLDSIHPNQPQILIHYLRAMLESFPQTIIQLYFIIQIGM